MMADRPVTYEEAVALATEIGESLGGRQQEALRVLVRYAARGHNKSSSQNLATTHFRKAADLARSVEVIRVDEKKEP